MDIKLHLDPGDNKELEKAFREYEEAYTKLYDMLLHRNLTFLTLRAEGKVEAEGEE